MASLRIAFTLAGAAEVCFGGAGVQAACLETAAPGGCSVRWPFVGCSCFTVVEPVPLPSALTAARPAASFSCSPGSLLPQESPSLVCLGWRKMEFGIVAAVPGSSFTCWAGNAWLPWGSFGWSATALAVCSRAWGSFGWSATALPVCFLVRLPWGSFGWSATALAVCSPVTLPWGSLPRCSLSWSATRLAVGSRVWLLLGLFFWSANVTRRVVGAGVVGRGLAATFGGGGRLVGALHFTPKKRATSAAVAGLNMMVSSAAALAGGGAQIALVRGTLVILAITGGPAFGSPALGLVGGAGALAGGDGGGHGAELRFAGGDAIGLLTADAAWCAFVRELLGGLLEAVRNSGTW